MISQRISMDSWGFLKDPFGFLVDLQGSNWISDGFIRISHGFIRISFGSIRISSGFPVVRFRILSIAEGFPMYVPMISFGLPGDVIWISQGVPLNSPSVPNDFQKASNDFS